MAFRAGLFNFSKGELAPELWGRVDVAAYSAGLRQATNVTILKYGGVTRRLGSRVVYEIREPEAGWDDPASAQRLFPFEFSITQSYVLLGVQAVFRPLALGGSLLEEELAITGVTIEDGAIITSPYHAYAVGDEWYPVGIAGTLGDHLNDRVWLVTEIIDDQHFRIDADTIGLDPFTTAEDGTVRVAEPDPPPPPPDVPPVYEPPDPPPVYNPGNPGYPGYHTAIP